MADAEGERISEALKRATGRIADEAVGDLRKGNERGIDGYVLFEELGAGGTGTVYVAQDPRHDRSVAVKLLVDYNDRARARFDREVDAMGKLQHPNIVPLFDSGDSNGCLYLVMELVDGHSLAKYAEDWLDDDPREHPDVARMVTAVRDAARAIHYAHGVGILHRDLKPHNLLLDRNHQVHVTDFGLALDAGEFDSRLTRTGAALGTPAYMSPEQATGKRDRIDERTDVYALGATLYHVLTGATPFDHCVGQDLLVAICSAAAPAASELNPKVSPALDAIIRRCMEKRPADRYADALSFAEDLDRYLEGQPTEAEALGPLGRIWRAAQRRPLVVGLISAVLVLGAMVLVLALYAARLAGELEGR